MDIYTLAKFNVAAYNHGVKKLPEGWKVLTDSNQENLSKVGFYGIAMQNEETNEVIVAFSGTSFNRPWDGNLIDDMKANYDILINKEIPTQFKEASSLFMNKIIEKVGAEVTEKGLTLDDVSFTLTGHSLGAVLSDLSAYQIKSMGVQNVQVRNFDNPGSKPLVDKLLQELPNVKESDFKEDDIQQFQSTKTLVNSWNEQTGETYKVNFEPDSGVINSALTFISKLDPTGIADSIKYHYFSNWMSHAFDRESGDFKFSPEIVDKELSHDNIENFTDSFGGDILINHHPMNNTGIHDDY